MTNPLFNTKYSQDKKPLSTVLASFGGAAVVFGSTVGAYAYPIAETDGNSLFDTPSIVIQTNDNRIGTYTSGQQSTQVDTFINNDREIYWSWLIKEDIIKSTESMYGYKILEMHESSLVDDEGTFTIYTAVLDLDFRDYLKLLDEEWEVSDSLGLYEKNIILRFL